VSHVLVVANETLGARSIVNALRERAEQGETHVTVVAPQTQPKAGYVVYADAVRDAAQARRRVQARRDHHLDPSGDPLRVAAA
jgi:hypothetical protein